jgi:hypothetical protein
MTMTDWARGTFAESDLRDLGLSVRNLSPGMELFLVVVKVKAIASSNDARISINDYDFDLVSESGTKYERISVYGIPKFTDMYAGAEQEAIICFQVSPTDENPLIVFKETSREPGFWFSLLVPFGATGSDL